MKFENGFLERVKEDFRANGGNILRPGFQALLVHRFGVWRMGIRTRAVRVPFSVLYRAMSRAVQNVYGIELPYSAKVGRRVVIEHQHGIVIHGNAEIGDECIIRQGVTLGLRRMDRPNEAPRLGRGVSIGAGAVVLGKVHVGDGAEIGANAVVLEDVPAGALAVGVPAKIVQRKADGQTADEDPNKSVPPSGRRNVHDLEQTLKRVQSR